MRTGDEPPRTLTIVPWTLRLHPTQLYETVSMVLLFLVLSAYYPFRRHDGQVMALMMVGYSMHRYVNELLRADQRPVGFEAWTSVVLFAAGVAAVAVAGASASEVPASKRRKKPPRG